MQVQVNPNDQVDGKEALIIRLDSEVRGAVARFSGEITRVEVHLSEENAGNTGLNDKRCLIEARLSGRQPETVTHQARSIEEAFRGAAGKLKRALESRLGRLTGHKGAASIRTEPA